MKQTPIVKTATLEDLKTKLATIVGWVEQGEDVMVKGKPTPAAHPTRAKVDLTQSAVFRRPPDQEKIAMTPAELQEFYQDMRGAY